MTKLLSATLLTYHWVTAAYNQGAPVQARPPVATAPMQAKSTTFDGIGIQPPNFNDIFDKIQQVSPLARSVMKGNKASGYMMAQGRRPHTCPSLYL